MQFKLRRQVSGLLTPNPRGLLDVSISALHKLREKKSAQSYTKKIELNQM